MYMRDIINIVSILFEGRVIKLDNGRRIIQSPSRSDILQMLEKSDMLRGEIIDFGNEPILYLWPGKLLSHWNAISDISKLEGSKFIGHISFKIGKTPENIKEDKYWRDAQIKSCDGYFVAFSKPDPHSYHLDFSSSKYFSQIFPD